MKGWTDLVDIQNVINDFDATMNKLDINWYEAYCSFIIASKSKFETIGFNIKELDEHSLKKLKEQYKENFELKFYDKQTLNRFNKKEYYCFIIIKDENRTINYEEFIQNKKLDIGNVIIEMHDLDIKASSNETEASKLRYMGMLNFSRLFSVADTVILKDCSFDIDSIAPTLRIKSMDVTKLIVDNCKFEQCTKISKLPELFPIIRELNVTNTKFGKTMNLDSLLDNSRVRTVDFTGTDFGKIKSAEKAFYNCIRLTRIDGISDLDMTECESCNMMFMHCSELDNLDISNWSIEHTNLRNLFNYCYNLKEVNINNIRFYTSKVAGMFNNINSNAKIALNNKIRFFDDFNKPLDVAGLLKLYDVDSTDLNISKQLFDITPVDNEVIQKGLREFLNLVDKLIQYKLESDENAFTVHASNKYSAIKNILRDLTNNIYRQKEKVLSNQMEIVNISRKEFKDKLKIKNDIMGNDCTVYDFYIGLLAIGNSADECKIYIMNGGE